MVQDLVVPRVLQALKVLKAQQEYGLDLSGSFMIGDHPHDVMTASELGLYDYYVKGNKHVVWDIAWTTKRVEQSPATQAVTPNGKTANDAK